MVVWILILAAGIVPGVAAGTSEDESHRISGRVTDFQNRPIQGASVELKNSRFDTVAKAVSDMDGGYSLAAPEGEYMALAAVKDYQTKYLEYWAWNVPLDRDIEINPRFDRLEVYAINAWRPQGAYPSYQVYFRPMSLTRVTKKLVEADGMEGLGKLPVIDISPDLAVKDIVVTIDGEVVKVLEVNKVREAVGPGQYMFGYVIQTDMPEKPTAGDYVVITVTLTDPETGEMGEGSLSKHARKPQAFKPGDEWHPGAEPVLAGEAEAESGIIWLWPDTRPDLIPSIGSNTIWYGSRSTGRGF